jgi:RNA polymerase sigma-70 factor (ECF subfamily)
MSPSPDRSAPLDEAEHLAVVQRLFIQYQPAVRGYILAMIPDFALADDVVQETFMVVSRKAATFEIGSSFSSWVRAIARFKALEALRSRKHRFEVLSDEVLEALDAEHRTLPSQVDERLSHLAACIEKLAPQAKRSIQLRYVGDHLPPEIARRMRCTVQSVNVTLSRARVFLRECVSRKMSNCQS